MIILHPDCFKHKVAYQYKTEPNAVIGKVEARKEGLVYISDSWKFPLKGYPYPEAVDAVADVKRLWMNFARVGWPVLVNLKKWKKFIIDESHFKLYRYYLNDDLYCPFARELLYIGRSISKSEDERYLAECVVMVFQYDEAYRYELQDAMFHGKSIKRTLEILIEGEKVEASKNKWRAVLKLYNMLNYIPSFRRKFKLIDKIFDWKSVGLDEADKYFAEGYKANYNFNAF